MEEFDVVIIGGGLGSLTTATYLSRRLRNVAVFEEGKKHKLERYNHNFRDEMRNKYSFNYYTYDIGGIKPDGLFYKYLRQCGLENSFSYIENKNVVIIDDVDKSRNRLNSFEDFKVYLVRYYPKQRDNIHEFFDILKDHYENYIIERKRMLDNEEFTLPSILVEWGDFSLEEVLKKFFTDKNLMNEFSMNYDTIGLPLNEINTYSYFIRWFDIYFEGSYFIKTKYEDIISAFTKNISKNRDRIFFGRKIVEYIVNDNGKIEKVIDNLGNEITAKFFVINQRVDKFIDKFIPSYQNEKEKFLKLYEHINTSRYINRCFIGLKQSEKKLGIENIHYMFSENDIEKIRLLSLVNFKKIDDSACKDAQGALMVEFIDPNLNNDQTIQLVKDEILRYFPNLKDNISMIRIDKKRPYFGSVSSKDFREGMGINDLFGFEELSVLNPLKNTFFIGSFLRPESGIIGMIQAGVIYGDTIEEKIYHGDSEEYLITNDKLMALITHEFKLNSLGKKEKNIQFFIGKSSYYIRTKGKYLRLFKGVYDISDLIIISTNDCLYDIAVGNMSIDDAIKSDGFEYIGDEIILSQVSNAFNMGNYRKNEFNYKYFSNNVGLKFLIGIIAIWVSFLFFSNLFDYLIITPIALIFVLTLVYYKKKVLKTFALFDFLSILSFISFLGASFSNQIFNTYHSDIFGLLLLSGFWLFSWLINKPLVFDYIKHDYRSDYTSTRLFRTMSGGLTFIWGAIFLSMAGITYLVGRYYFTLVYYLVLVALFLTFYYPNAYIKSNFKN